MILFKNVTVVTMESEENVMKNGYVAVRGNTIVYVGVDKPKENVFAKEIDCENKVMMPGLVNTHSHVPMALLRGIGDDLPLEVWLETKIYPAENRLTDNITYWGTLLGISEMLACGTVSYSDMYFYNDAIIRATIESGMKANISKAMICFDPTGEDDGGRFEEALELYHQYNNAEDGKIKIDMAFHAIYTSNPTYLKNIMGKIGEMDVQLQYHMSETVTEHETCKKNYGKTPGQVFEECGMMKKRGIAAHCVHATKEDFDVLAKNHIAVSTCPSSNLKLGSGIADVRGMLKQGVLVTIGTDGCASNNNLNMFEEMHLTGLLNKGYYQDPTAVSAFEVLKMATINGARAQGRKKSGMIKEGYAADLILIDFDKPHLCPNQNTIGNLVYSAQGSDVCMTMCDGKILYEDGRYTTLDIENIKEEAKRCCKILTE